MQPWVNKNIGSSSGSSTLHFDKTLSLLNNNQQSQQQQQQQQQQSQHGFRTVNNKGKSAIHYDDHPQHDDQQLKNTISNFTSYQYTSYSNNLQSNLAPHEDMADGTEILEFLNSTSYSDAVYADDLRPDSMTYISYRHQMDTQHALSEKEKLQQHWTAELLSSEDIVEYLLTADYTQDIYGIPVLGQYIKEAKEELISENSESKRVAVERLTMIRSHLLSKSNGNPVLAAQRAFEMNENDWSKDFAFDSF